MELGHSALPVCMELEQDNPTTTLSTCMEQGQNVIDYSDNRDVNQEWNKGYTAPLSKLTLGLVDSDSTIVYYNIYNGIQKPFNGETAALTKTRS